MSNRAKHAGPRQLELRHCTRYFGSELDDNVNRCRRIEMLRSLEQLAIPEQSAEFNCRSLGGRWLLEFHNHYIEHSVGFVHGELWFATRVVAGVRNLSQLGES